MSKKILVVDDSITFRTVIDLVLGARGYEIVTAADGVAVIEKFNHVDFDLVITDINMPDMDGYALARHIKATNNAFPVIALTGEDVPIAEAFDMVLPKPFDTRKLLRVVKDVLANEVPPSRPFPAVI